MIKKQKVLVTGATGFVGSFICKYLSEHGYEVRGIDLKAADGVESCDVAQPAQLLQCLKTYQPKVIVHCAAIKNLPACEEDKGTAVITNTLSTETIAQYAKEHGTKIVYLSSDVVFDGMKGQYEPDDLMNPINWYGKTKAFSEVILRSVPRSLVCRTALIIGSLSDAYKEILKTEIDNEVLVNQTLLPQYIYARLKSGRPVRLPSQIISNPTPVELLAEFVERGIALDAEGVIHATGPDALSRLDTGKLIAELFNFDPAMIVEDQATISPLRPKDISMKSDEAFRKLEIDPENWRLKDYLAAQHLYK